MEDFDLKKYTRYEKKDKPNLPNVQPHTYQYKCFMAFTKNQCEDNTACDRSSETIFNMMPCQNKNVNQHTKLKESDFEKLSLIGRGGFGKVVLCKKKDTGKCYAVKILKKSDIMQKDHMDKIRNEKNIMMQNDHQFLLGLEFCFHDQRRIYFGMNYLPGGQLASWLQHYQKFPEDVVRFYAAQIVFALEYLHERNIIYRDLKPENVCLDKNGYVKLVDYGVSKFLAGADSKTQSVVGSYEYFAPEILIQKGYNKMADWWCLGILLYELSVGKPPFSDKNDNTLFTLICKYNFNVPEDTISGPLEDLIRKLLIKDPDSR